MYKVEWRNFVERLTSSREVKEYVQDNGIILPPITDIRPSNFAPGRKDVEFGILSCDVMTLSEICVSQSQTADSLW